MRRHNPLDHLQEFARRGVEAQRAVDQLTGQQPAGQLPGVDIPPTNFDALFLELLADVLDELSDADAVRTFCAEAPRTAGDLRHLAARLRRWLEHGGGR